MNRLDKLPTEILFRIFEYVTVDTTGYEYPNALDTFFLRSVQIREPYMHQVQSSTVLSLMFVNRFFYDFVGSVVFRNLAFMGQEFTEKSFLNDDAGPFVFDIKNSFQRTSVLPKYYYEELRLRDRALPIVENLLLCTYDFDYTTLLGTHWLEGKIEIVSTNLKSLLIDTRLFSGVTLNYLNSKFIADRPYWRRFIETDSQDVFAPFIVEYLKDPNAKHAEDYYELHILHYALAKLVAAQKPGMSCEIISQSENTLDLAGLLWVFDKHSVLDTIETMEIIEDRSGLFTDHFPHQLKKMKKLKSFLYTCYSETTHSDKSLENLFGAVECLESLEQMTIAVEQPLITPKFPSKLNRLSVNNRFLWSRQVAPFGSYLDNIVELCLDFDTLIPHSIGNQESYDTMFKMKNLRTLNIKGYLLENVNFLTTLLLSNPDITSFSLFLSAENHYDFLEFLQDLPNVECLSINFVFTDTSSDEDESYGLNQLLSFAVSGLLPSLKVLLISSNPPGISFKQLIHELAYNYREQTCLLDKIYLYGNFNSSDSQNESTFYPDVKSYGNGSDSDNDNNDPLSMSFLETTKEIATIFEGDFEKPEVKLEDFMEFKYMSPKSNEMPYDYNMRISMDVKKIMRILGYA